MNSLTHFKWISIIHTILILNYYFISTDSMTTSVNDRDIKFPPGKRNTWWSKKSSTEDIAKIDKSRSLSYQTVTSILDCYADTCLKGLASCVQQAEDVASEFQCKYQHRKCALRCLQDFDELSDLSSQHQ